MNPRGRIQAVLFDIDDTLVDFTGAAHRALVHAVHTNLGPVPAEHIAAAWEEIAEPHYRRYTNGELTFVQMREARTAAFVDLLSAADGGRQASTGVHLAIENDRHASIFDHYRLYDDVLDEVNRLRAAGFRIGLVSNSDGDYQRRKLSTVGLTGVFAAEVFSGDLGIAKPAPEIFHAGVAALGSTPNRTVYVGDKWDVDVLGARGAGLAAVWLHRGGQRGESAHPADQGPGQQDPGIRRIAGLTELADALDGLESGRG